MNSNEIITAPVGTPNAIWWVEETKHKNWVWYYRNKPNSQWELRHRDKYGNTCCVNTVWKDPDKNYGWRFWDPTGQPGSAAYCWRLTLSWAKAACLAMHI